MFILTVTHVLIQLEWRLSAIREGRVPLIAETAVLQVPLRQSDQILKGNSIRGEYSSVLSIRTHLLQYSEIVGDQRQSLDTKKDLPTCTNDARTLPHPRG